MDINANTALCEGRSLHNLTFCRSYNIAMDSGRVRIGDKRIFPEAHHLLYCGIWIQPPLHSLIQKQKPQWLHCSFKRLNTCWSTYRSAKGYSKSCRAMCCPARNWSSTRATRHCLVCHLASIISQAWQARFISTTRALACRSTFSNNCLTVSVIHCASSCWAPLHATLLKAIAAQWSLWCFQTTAHLSSSFAYYVILHDLGYDSFS
jgi:hypothetical protein